MLDPFSLSVTAGVASTVLWEGAKRAWYYRSNRVPLATFYTFDKTARLWIILSGETGTLTGEYFDYVTPIDGVLTYDTLSDYLNQLTFKREQFASRFSEDLGDFEFRDNLILIGGYEHNTTSKQLNKLPGRSFYLESNTIVEADGGKVWKVDDVVGPNGKKQIKKDYCLITRIANPWCQSPKNTIVIAFEGVRHYGTIGGVRFANETLPGILKTSGIKLHKGTQIELVVGFSVNYTPGARGTFTIDKGVLVTGYVDRKKVL